MKILLFGKDGQVGWELQRSLAPLGNVIALGRAGSGDLCGDLANGVGIAQTVQAVAPDVIVNAAAYTAVDKAESEAGVAAAINATAPGVLAREAGRLGALLVHYSTDYVFDGTGTRAWKEGDPTGPISVYGSTKLEGEQEIVASSCRHLIFRTSWVYASRGGNFAKTMLRLAGERDALTVIDDQKGAPTGAELISDITAQAVSRAQQTRALDGIYHLAAAGETSWYDYAKFVLDLASMKGTTLKATSQQVTRCESSAYKTAARRPLNSRLDTSKLAASFGLHLPSWKDGVSRMVTEILEQKA